MQVSRFGFGFQGVQFSATTSFRKRFGPQKILRDRFRSLGDPPRCVYVKVASSLGAHSGPNVVPYVCLHDLFVPGLISNEAE